MIPEQNKTTMSVAEMRKMLGLGKTDAYWLVHKNCFETIRVNGKMRIVICSFEKWYANQVKHAKVEGPPPGEELKAASYSVREVAQILSIDKSSVYYLIKRDRIPTFQAENWTWIRKTDFDRWYASQNKHRTREDRKKDAELAAETLTMPEMARELDITRKEAYRILSKKENRNIFDKVVIADRKRITRESFERWYAGQSEYRKLSDRTPEELEQSRIAEKREETPRLMVSPDKPSYNVRETAILMDLTLDEVRQLIREGTLAAKKYGASYIIRRESIKWWLEQQKLFIGS